MANIIIDGYNLMGLAHRNLEKARNDLILQLGIFAGRRGHDITVVFDGWKNGEARETREKRGALTIVYSPIGLKADQVIKNILTSSMKPWIVISSDREIAHFAEKKSFAALTRDEFREKLDFVIETDNPAVTGESEEVAELDAHSHPPGTKKKGNPRKLSRKDKRKGEALKKL